VKRIPVALSEGRSYELVVGGRLASLGRELARLVKGRRALVVSAGPIARRYAPPLMRGLKRAGFRAHLALIPDGEQHKTLDAPRRLYGQALRAGIDRRCPLVALGGGVVGDVAGFTAATFLRGVPLAQCPTTLLAMVDASVGGKTGVDLAQGKNLVGAFWQPVLVWMDLSTLRTLPDRQWRTGMAEVIKYGLIADRKLFEDLEAADPAAFRRDPRAVETIVARSAAIKAGVVARDERETRGLREILNLGHTFGHALETATGYTAYTHGEAIAVGMAAAARLGEALGTFPSENVARVDRLLERWGLPTRARRPLSRGKILRAMSKDKKTMAGRFRFVVPQGWGRARVVSGIPRERLERTLDAVGI